MAEESRPREATGAEVETGTALKRRGILAAAGAAVAGLALRHAAQPVAAAFPLQGDADNAATGNTNIHGPGAAPSWITSGTIFRPVLSANNTGGSANGTGIAAYGPDFGIAARAIGTAIYAYGSTAVSAIGAPYYGVDAVSNDGSGAGVRGSNGVGGKGVHGVVVGAGTGVYGQADTGTAIYGTSGGVYGVYGISSASGGCGVRGDCTGGYGVLGTVSDGYGVLGQAVTGNGVRGFSSQNHAIVGQTARPYFGGVVGYATLDQTVGIYGTTNGGGGNNANAFAGYMDGNFVVVNGVKSAAVRHADGSHRLVYCMESPENWFEDFGEAKLVNGRAEVRLDADFAAVVETAGYQVFLTTYGASQGLDVISRAPGGFAVAERNKGTASLTFGWRVVAKRKDIKAGRLARFDLVGKAKDDAGAPKVPSPPPATQPLHP